MVNLGENYHGTRRRGLAISLVHKGQVRMLDVVRIRVSETSSHLLGRAALGQMRPHILPQPGLPGVSAVVAADGLGWPPGCDRGGPIGTAPRGVARRLAAHGAGGSAPTPWPSFAANGRGPISNSRSELGLKLLLNQQCENCEQHKAIVVKEQWKRCQSEAGRLGSERTWAFVSS